MPPEVVERTQLNRLSSHCRFWSCRLSRSDSAMSSSSRRLSDNVEMTDASSSSSNAPAPSFSAWNSQQSLFSPLSTPPGPVVGALQARDDDVAMTTAPEPPSQNSANSKDQSSTALMLSLPTETVNVLSKVCLSCALSLSKFAAVCGAL